MFKTYPSAPQDSSDRIVILKSDQNAAHRSVLKDQREQQSWQQEDHIQLPVLSYVHKSVVKACAFFLLFPGGNSFRPSFHFVLLSENISPFPFLVPYPLSDLF